MPALNGLHRVAEAFADEPEPQRVLMARTVARLEAFESAGSRAAHAPVPAWLSAALERIGQRLSTFSPPDAMLAWRYLIATRQLACAQEAAWRESLNRPGSLPECPLTPESVSIRTTPFRVIHRTGEPVAVAGLGTVLAGYWLPAAGRRRVVEAITAGLDWNRPEVFERQWTMRLAAPSPTPDAVDRTAPPAAAEPGDRSPPPTATALREALVSGVRQLCVESRCNVNGARVWITRDSVWVVARPLAERLAAHPALQAHPHLLQRRAVLYRALVSHGLVLANGPKPVWKVVLRFGAQRQRADVLKLRVETIWPEASERPPVIDADRVAVEASSAAGKGPGT